MANAIRFSLDRTDEKVIVALQQRRDILIDALTQKMSYVMLQLQRKVQQKLSGEVLQNRDGVLYNSVQVQPTTFNGKEIIGAVTAAGGPAKFGQVFEYGGTRTYKITPVDKKALAFMVGANALDVLRGDLSSKAVVVKSVWHPPAIKRPFMSTSLDESIGSIREGLRDAIGAVLEEPI